MAQQVLTQFQEHPDSWTRVPDILDKSSFPQSKVGYLTNWMCNGSNVRHNSTLVSKSSKSSSQLDGKPYRMDNGKVSIIVSMNLPPRVTCHIYRYPKFYRRNHRKGCLRRSGLPQGEDIHQQIEPCSCSSTCTVSVSLSIFLNPRLDSQTRMAP